MVVAADRAQPVQRRDAGARRPRAVGDAARAPPRRTRARARRRARPRPRRDGRPAASARTAAGRRDPRSRARSRRRPGTSRIRPVTQSRSSCVEARTSAASEAPARHRVQPLAGLERRDLQRQSVPGRVELGQSQQPRGRGRAQRCGRRGAPRLRAPHVPRHARGATPRPCARTRSRRRDGRTRGRARRRRRRAARASQVDPAATPRPGPTRPRRARTDAGRPQARARRARRLRSRPSCRRRRVRSSARRRAGRVASPRYRAERQCRGGRGAPRVRAPARAARHGRRGPPAMRRAPARARTARTHSRAAGPCRRAPRSRRPACRRRPTWPGRRGAASSPLSTSAHTRVASASAIGVSSADIRRQSVVRAGRRAVVSIGVLTRFWHPFADMGLVEERGELVLERGAGARLWDEQGRSYVDATAALWYCNVGYGRDEIGDAAAAQIRKIPAYSAYGDLATRPPSTSPSGSRRSSPLDDARVFFTSGGAESIESASKLARRFFSLTGEPERTDSDLAPARLPRRRRLRDEPGRARTCSARASSAPVPRRPARRLGLGGRAARRDRPGRRRARGGVLLRAGDRRGRRARSAARLPRRGARDLPRRRLPARRRRGDHELRPLRPLVRERALRARSRPDRVREGLDLRLPAARRRDRLRYGSPSRSGSRAAASSSGTATRTRGTPRSRRRRTPTSTSSTATA